MNELIEREGVMGTSSQAELHAELRAACGPRAPHHALQVLPDACGTGAQGRPPAKPSPQLPRRPSLCCHGPRSSEMTRSQELITGHLHNHKTRLWATEGPAACPLLRQHRSHFRVNHIQKESLEDLGTQPGALLPWSSRERGAGAPLAPGTGPGFTTLTGFIKTIQSPGNQFPLG